MDDRISNDYISTAIDELVNILGVKEEPLTGELLTLLNKRETRQCIKEIAKILGLDIEIKLTYVPKGYKTGSNNKFESSQLVKTNWRGQGVDGITAQVFIPENLPGYGTSTLKDFPIDVRVSEDCQKWPHTFISVISHELSHILLASLHHSQRNNEVYTDLTPMILGFSSIVELGRKTSYTTTEGNTTTTHTTSYGYLNDTQFFFARDKINNLLEIHRHDKIEVQNKISQMGRLVSRIKENLHQFKKLLDYLDEHRKRKINEQDGRRIVQFHAFSYNSDIENEIDIGERLLEETESYSKKLKHYINNTKEMITSYGIKLDMIASSLEQLNHSLEDDLRVLKKNVSLVYKVKLNLSSKLNKK